MTDNTTYYAIGDIHGEIEKLNTLLGFIRDDARGAGGPTKIVFLGDLIDLAQDNSVRWPVPHALPVARDGSAVAPAPRRHYLRISGQPHPGLERKLDGLVRRHGLTVQNRATRLEQRRHRHLRASRRAQRARREHRG